MKIGFVGLGHLGAGIAGALAENGHEVHGRDLDSRAVARAAEKGVIAEASPKAVAAASEIVFTCLPNSESVAEVCLERDGVIEGGRAGLLVIDCTSGYPPKTLEIAAALARKGIRMIDAPVTGGEGGGGAVAAPNRALTMIVGGGDEDVKRAWPILETVAKRLHHVGPLGHGHVIKAVNNMIGFTARMATIEGLAVAAKYGIDPVIVAKVLSDGTGISSTALRIARTAKVGFAGTPNDMFSIGLMAKDLRQMAMVARDVGMSPFLVGHAAAEAQSISDAIGAEADINDGNLEFARRLGVAFPR